MKHRRLYKVLQVTVDRSKWLQGEGEEDSYLYRPDDGKMCCLGFVGLAAGLSEEIMADVSTPSGLITDQCITIPESMSGLVDMSKEEEYQNFNSKICGNLMTANDEYLEYDYDKAEQVVDPDFLPKKEATLIELGKQIGIEFSFIGQYQQPEESE